MLQLRSDSTTQDQWNHFTDYGQMDVATRERLEDMAFRFGRNYDSYLITEPNRQYLWSSDMSGVIGFQLKGRYVKVVGGLIAADDNRRQLLRAVLAFVRKNNYSLSMFNISDEELPLYREFGFQPNKIGEDASIDLRECTWSGKQYDWVRRQSNFVRRQKMRMIEVTQEASIDDAPAALLEELAEVSTLHIAEKPQKEEMGLFVGQFLPGYMHRRRVFIARSDDGNGRIDGFIVCTPGLNGQQWGIEMYRQRPDAVRGVIPALMHHAMNQMKAEGVERASLCLIPVLRCEEKIEGDRAMTRWTMILFNRLLNSVYDTKGLYHYKSRFRPEFANRYVCCYPKGSFGASMAFLSAWGVLNVKPGRVLINLIRNIRPSRWTIARPAKRVSPVANESASKQHKAA